MKGWSLLEAEAKSAFAGSGRFPLRAYSEFMPPPYVAIKPYAPSMSRALDACTSRMGDELTLDITEYEQSEELEPGLGRIATLLVTEVARLARGTSRLMSHTLLDDNPAWPAALADAAMHRGFAQETFSIALPLALSRTQDDKGNVRWTLFGASHEGPSLPFWASFKDGDGDRFDKMIAWMAARSPGHAVRVLADPGESLPSFARGRLLDPAASLDGVEILVTFRPFASLPEAVQRAYLERRLQIVPSPGSLVFFEHKRYRELSLALPRATQIPLLHLFPRVEGGYAIRIPQSGWQHEPGHDGYAHGHRIVSSVVRTHRWQRVERDEHVGAPAVAFADEVTTALFSTDPDDIGLYGKPMAKNAQVWTQDYTLLLDGPNATREQLARAAAALRDGGRYGYRFLYPPMRGGRRELFWHLPLVARLAPEARHVTRYKDDAPLGYVTAELAPTAASDGANQGAAPVRLEPRLLARSWHTEAATLFPRDPGHLRNTTSHNVRKLLEFGEMLGTPLPPAFARQLVFAPKHASYDDWLARIEEIGSHPHAARMLTQRLRELVGQGLGKPASNAPLPVEAPPGRTFAATATREYEERMWRTIVDLSEGKFRSKENADVIAVNEGKTGGHAGHLAKVSAAERSDLSHLGDHLHARHREIIARHGMTGRAEVVDHAFAWETDFDFPWSEGWAKGQKGARERNVVVVIPGKNRSEAVLLADHYDTAYMEDVYEAERGGDGLRAAAHGADDNHSGTASLLLAAEVLLPLAHAGRLERDVWLVHLTGEEFPSDCMGARALAQAVVEERLAFVREDDSPLDVSKVRIAGAYVLDMIAHNNMRDRDTFLICPGEGAASARLALEAHRAVLAWNRDATALNGAPERAGKGRAQRMPDGKKPPPAFEHLAVHGQIAAEWEPRSVLYNTDGQIFSDVGVPVVLFMENYDINRAGYHDTHDTMKNIDLDYAAAISAIAIETVVAVATAASV